MELNRNEHLWLTRYRQVREYMIKHKKIPPRGSYPSLNAWCTNQRFAHLHEGRLIQWKIVLLEQLPGWVWAVRRPARETYFNKKYEQYFIEFVDKVNSTNTKKISFLIEDLGAE